MKYILPLRSFQAYPTKCALYAHIARAIARGRRPGGDIVPAPRTAQVHRADPLCDPTTTPARLEVEP
jgi:hypothetical protein